MHNARFVINNRQQRRLYLPLIYIKKCQYLKKKKKNVYALKHARMLHITYTF